MRSHSEGVALQSTAKASSGSDKPIPTAFETDSFLLQQRMAALPAFLSPRSAAVSDG